MAYHNVLCDWDGVFVETPLIWNEAVAAAGLEFKLTLTPEQIRLLSADFSRAMDFGLDKKHYDAYSKRVRVIGNQRCQYAPLYEGAFETAQQLSLEGKKLAIVSSNWNVVDDLRRNDMLQFFSVVVSGRDTKNHKPHPEGILTALTLLRAEQQDSVFVGDAWTDIKAASSAGIPSVLYHPDSHTKSHDLAEIMRYNPTHTVRSHAELKSLLTKSRNGSSR